MAEYIVNIIIFIIKLKTCMHGKRMADKGQKT